jgi:hypothetical protein
VLDYVPRFRATLGREYQPDGRAYDSSEYKSQYEGAAFFIVSSHA